MRSVLAIFAVLAFAVPEALADDADHAVHGFTTAGAGELHGRVLAGGKPVAKKTVRVVSAKGEQTATTDKDGRFTLTLKDTAMVYVEGPYSVEGDVVTGEKVIKIDAILPPAVSPKPKTNPAYIPGYSDKAIDDNVWARAWVMLDISATGKVSRVKLLNAPGHGLDEIAIKAALDLKIEPALDRANKPIDSVMLWTFEWPPYWLMQRAKFSIYRVPEELRRVACGKPGERERRDCTRPDIARALSAPWLTRRNR